MQKTLYVPTTIIDGFLDYPEVLRDFALKQEYKQSNDGRWPGVRSEPLHKLSPLIFETYIQKILNIFFTKEQPYTFNADSFFQIVNKDYESGWVHRDPDVVTAMLYLTPGSISGTSLYSKKNIFYNDGEHKDKKLNSYLGITGKTETIAREIHNSNFECTLDVKGIFNRMLVFDSQIYHAAHEFFGQDINDSRLTLVTFFTNITGTFSAPLQRSRNIFGGTIL
jgi:hypothetical protein